MQDAVMQSAVQPFVKLLQSNMVTLGKFSMSPQAISLAMSNGQAMLQGRPDSQERLFQSGAFVELMQGMFRNYAEFMTELGHSSLTMLADSQSAWMQRSEEAVEGIASPETRGRRAR